MTIARVLASLALAAAFPALGQNVAPATAAAAAAPPAAAEPSPAPQAPVLGRLFFTPAERARLDELRRRPPPPPAEVAAAKPEAPPTPPAPQYVTLNGVVRRSDGTTTVWLNNKPVTGPRTEEGLLVTPSGRSSGNVTVQVPETGRRIDLKVGQQVEIRSGQVQEAYESRAVAAATSAAAAAETRSAEPPPSATPPRRSNRERDLLRDLLREIEGPEAARPGQNAPSAPKAP